MLPGGAGLLTACPLAAIVAGIVGVKVPLLGRHVLLGAVLGLGMIVYGGLQPLFGLERVMHFLIGREGRLRAWAKARAAAKAGGLG